MSRRLSALGIAILVLFGIVAGQSANIQFFRASSLNQSSENPRVTEASTVYPRGDIYAANGQTLAESVATSSSYYPWRRVYPLGRLVSGIVGFSGPAYGQWALEQEYDDYLTAHSQPPQSVAQLLAPTKAADSITLTLYPSLQAVAARAMGGQDGAAVVLNPKNGDVLAMYSNPTFNPVPLTSPTFSVAAAAWKTDTTDDAHGFPPLGLVATQQTFPPGSTFKVVTTAAVVAHDPSLLSKRFHYGAYTALPDSNKLLYNDGGTACGGTIAEMLPVSCDPGYALVGLALGGSTLTETAEAFGYNSVPPLDLPYVVASSFPASFVGNLPFVAYSAIGQGNVRSTALQDALVASGVANGGAIMTPHLLDYVSGPDGTLVKRYQPSIWLQPLTASQAAQIVPLMVNVARFGTAAGIFPYDLDVAAKTGTAQTGNSLKNTDDWMIAFAPATDPTVAVAVVMPFQAESAFGATVAGPIVKCLIEATLALQSGHKVAGTSTTCPV